MDVNTAYEKFQIKANKNSETGKIGIDRGRFVITYNEAQNKYIEYLLDKKNEDDIRYLQKVLITDYPISSSESKEEYQKFTLPEDFFDFSSTYAKANCENCKNKKISLFEIKDDDSEEILQDEFNKPSFIAREAPFHIANNTIKVYKENFNYSKIYLSYYRYPLQIKLKDPEDPESQFDLLFNPEFDDKLVDRIISLASGEFELNNESPKSQADKSRAQNKL